MLFLICHSERHLSDAILVWLKANTIESEDSSSDALCRQVGSMPPYKFIEQKDSSIMEVICSSIIGMP